MLGDMAIIGSLFALAGRFAGRVVNALLGWATILLFGSVEARKQTILGFVVMGSLAWVAAIVGLIVPDVGTLLVAAIPRPDFVDEGLIRLGMLAAVIAIPLAIGAVGLWLAGPDSRARRGGLVLALLRGYPFTAMLAVMMVFLAVIAFVRKVNSLRRRWQDAHVPVIVKPGRYDEVVSELTDVLQHAGVTVEARAAPRALSLPAQLLERAAGKALGGMVPDHLTLLAGPGLEILLYPSDIAIAGEARIVARSRAAIASRLTEAPAWMTVSAEARAIEDRLEAIARTTSGSARRRWLADVDRMLASAVIPFEEWETLYRMRLQLEHDVLDRSATEGAVAPSEVVRGASSDSAQGEARAVPGHAVSAAASAEAELEVAAVADRDPAVTLTDDGALQDWKRIGGLVGAAGLLGLLVADIAILLRREDRVVVGAGRQSLRSRGWLGRLLGGLR